MLDSFGARMRRRREERNIALATIAEKTKIKSSLLEGLEREDFSHWPAGMYRRAYVRAYAGAIGLDPDVVVREFLDTHPDVRPEPVPEPDQQRGAPTRLRGLIEQALSSFSRPRPAAPAEVAPRRADPAPALAITPDPDFAEIARLCTQLSRADLGDDVGPVLQEAAKTLEAVGVIVWAWDASAEELTPKHAYGYPQKILDQIPAVKRSDSNVTAAAFRSAQPCEIPGHHRGRGAVAVPLMTPSGCVGVLAIELMHGRPDTRPTRHAATILAAQLTRFVTGESSPKT